MLRAVRALAVAALTAAAAARAQSMPVALRLEPGAAFFVSSAQQQRYGPSGAALGARAELPVWGLLSAELGAGLVAFPFPTAPSIPAAGALSLGAGARANFQPAWVGAAANLVSTGPNLRFGYELGAGGALGKLGPIALGPYVRFLHVLQPPIPLQDPSSAMVLSAGLSLSYTLGEPGPAAPASGAPGGPANRVPQRPRVAPAAQVASGEDLVVLTKDRIQIKAPTRFENVRFEPGTAQIARESYLVLATVAKVIFLHPEIRRVRIEGHTDSVGGREANRELSSRRAEAVRRHLIEMNGVEEDRLEAVGYGPDQPVAGNDTPEGRSQNRRVEFVITERADGTSGGTLPPLAAPPPAPAPGNAPSPPVPK